MKMIKTAIQTSKSVYVASLETLYILKHFRNAPFYILLFLLHGWVDDIFVVKFYVHVQWKAICFNLALIMPFVLTLS